MFDGGSNFQNDVYANVPNMAMMNMMYSPLFGNGNFVIQPASKGEVQMGFPSIPYFPLEAVIYQQQMSNPVAQPINTLGGSNTGQQVVSSVQTVNDSTGTSRSLIGNQQTG